MMKLTRMKASVLRLAALGCWLSAVVGCGGPRLSDKEIGQPIYELPKLPGADEPYPMPELDNPDAGVTTDDSEVGPKPAPKPADAEKAQSPPAGEPTPATPPNETSHSATNAAPPAGAKPASAKDSP